MDDVESLFAIRPNRNPEARSIPARGESVELLPSIFKLVGSNLILSRREVLQENRIVFAIQSRDRYAQNCKVKPQ